MVVSWFSAGVSSAVATKLMVDQIDKIIYVHIDDQHPDTIRFVKDCESWFGKEIEIMQSPYKTVESVLLAMSYVNSPYGAPCTKILKKRVRKEWESGESHTYVWGLDVNEKDRIVNLEKDNPQHLHTFPLIKKHISKMEAHTILSASGIKRPAMYELGYYNNNCIGCVKGKFGYWNKIRIDFPDVFKARAEMERLVGATCINGVFLDELEPDRGRKQKPICDDCGILCETICI